MKISISTKASNLFNETANGNKKIVSTSNSKNKDNFNPVFERLYTYLSNYYLSEDTKEEDNTGYDYLNNTATYSFTDEPLFNTAFKEGANNKVSRKMYSRRDDFGSQMPIEVIAQCNPIIILDEP